LKLSSTISRVQLSGEPTLTYVEEGLAKAEASSRGFADSATSNFSAAKLGIVGLGVAALAAGGIAVKMAGDFQQATIQLVTGAGESRDNLGMVTSGILQMSSQVATSSQDLVRSMYVVESAGHHGADGLLVLRAAAEAAKAGNADLGTVTDALTSIMASYHESGKEGISIANQADDLFGMLVSAGVVSWFAFETFENIGMTLGIMPVAGIPLPFVSYGGSSMFANFIAIGLLQNVRARSLRSAVGR